ncbi:MAG TPA: hypothetical protein VJ781_03000 [Pyrinomonadaceae bacterium]|jgi:hypothetical protein|nr:hypothetical protein [Pyrinomonadaceae bacterium]
MTGRDHARLLGLLFWLLTGFQLLIVGLIGLLYVVIFGAVFATAPRNANDPPPELIFIIVVAVVAILLVTTFLFAIPKIVAGYGLRKEKSWARVWAIVACCMGLMSVPLGTAVGVYGLVFLMGENGRAYFEDPNYGRLPANTVTAPPPNSWQ